MKSNEEILAEQAEECYRRAIELIWSEGEPELTCDDIKRVLLREFGETVVEAVAKRF